MVDGTKIEGIRRWRGGEQIGMAEGCGGAGVDGVGEGGEREDKKLGCR